MLTKQLFDLVEFFECCEHQTLPRRIRLSNPDHRMTWLLRQNAFLHSHNTMYIITIVYIHFYISLQSTLVTPLIMTRLDYGSATLAGLPHHWLDHLQSVLNAVARLVCYAQKYNHITHLLRDLHWLRVPEKYNFDWPYSFSGAATTWRLHTSSAIFNGLTKWSRCDDYGPALNSA